MKFYDLDSLGEKQGLDNKYILTAKVAARARALSEQKGRTLEENNEKFISTALQQFDLGAVRIIPEDVTSEKSCMTDAPDGCVEE